MQKLFDFFEFIRTDANSTGLLLACLLVLLVVLLLFLVRQEKYFWRRKLYKNNLLFILTDFSNFCFRQYQCAMQQLQTAKTAKTQETAWLFARISQPDHMDQLWVMLWQNPEIFIMRKIMIRASSRLTALRDTISYQQQHLNDLITTAQAEYKANEKLYFQHITNLGRLRDSLEQFVGKKMVGRSADMEWLNNYMTIFSDWYREGASREITASYKAIVIRVLQLNKQYSDAPLATSAVESALQCQIAYFNIVKTEKLVYEQIQEFAWHHRLAAKITTLLAQKLRTRLPIRQLSRSPSYHPRKAKTNYTETYIETVTMHAIIPRRHRILTLASFGAIAALLTGSIILNFRFRPTRPETAHKTPLLAAAPVSPVKQTQLAPVHPVTTPVPVVFTANAPQVYGIDISRYQGDLMEEIDQLDTLHFVICKATEGATYLDPDFTSNWQFIRRKGLLRGAYHFFQSSDDPLVQAVHFARAINDVDSLDLPPVIDIEEGGITPHENVTRLQTNLLVVLQYLEQTFHRKPIIYTGLSFANTYLNNEAFAGYPLWLAEYTRSREPRIPVTWKQNTYTIWQKSDSYSVNSRSTDFDVFNGNSSQLATFIREH